MKTKEQILDSLKRIAVDVAGIDPEKMSVEGSLRSDLGLDSLDMIELVTALEDEVGVRLTDKEMSKIETVTNFIDALYEAQGREVAPA